MSKKEQFKALLNDSGDTGSQQKDRILDSHLIPPNSIGNPTTQNDVQTITGGNTGSESNKPGSISDQSAETSHKEQDSGKPSGQPVIPSAPSAPPPSGELHSNPVQVIDQSDLTSMVSHLKNMNELKVEDTHTRMTYLIDNKLLAELNELSAGKKKGYKTKVINTGLQIALELMRQDNNPTS